MKILRIPLFVLVALLVFALTNGAWMERRCSGWTDELDAIDQSVLQDDWDGAQQQLYVLYKDWQSAQLWLHITADHEEINAAEGLFCRSLVLSQEADSVEFRAHIAELRSQLQLLYEMERLSIKNIL